MLKNQSQIQIWNTSQIFTASNMQAK
jgi:hypothetical protein